METWADEDGALQFIKDLKARRRAQVDLLLGAASHSTDAAVRANWAAIAQIDQVIDMMEKERGNPDE
jgi:hypothetical protein